MHPTTPSHRRLTLGAVVLCFCAAMPTLASAQQTTTHAAINVEGNKKLLSAAKITPDSAAAIAAAKVPGTTASTVKFEGKSTAPVYTVSLLKAGSKDIDRVWIDANTGTVTRTKHYGGVSGRVRHAHQAHEAKEAKQGKS
ncbi:MAG: PepSY domain-containing protein [Gemmatimonadaceae bacterium]